MRQSAFLPLLAGLLFAGPATAQTDDEWRTYCTDEAALAAFRERVVESDWPILDWEVKMRCPRLDLPRTPLHETAGASRATSHTDWVYDARYSADGKTILSAGKDGSLIIWDAEAGDLLERIVAPAGPAPGSQSSYSYVRAAVFAGEGLVAATKDGYPVLLFDGASGDLVREVPEMAPGDGDYFPPIIEAGGDGLLILAGPEDEVVAVDVDDMAVRYRLPGHGEEAMAIAVASDADLLATAGNRPGHVMLWRLSTGEKLGEIPAGEEGDPRALALSRDGSSLAVATSGTARVYSIPDWQVEATVVVHPMFSIFDLTFTADGTGLITCQQHPILWDIASGEIVRHFGPFYDLCHSADVSPDGKFLVTGSMASDVKIWEIETGAFYRRLGIDVRPPR